jgi:hypothetical protein
LTQVKEKKGKREEKVKERGKEEQVKERETRNNNEE